MDRILHLPHGRKLALRELGPPDAPPVFYFHGWPGSRLEPQAALSAGVSAPLRVLALDRPGYGASDFDPDRTLAHWASDIAFVADTLRLKRFSVMGVSGGGPYALACAAKLPNRVASAVVVCGMGPSDTPGGISAMALHNRLMLRLGPRWPRIVRVLVGWALSRNRESVELLPRRLGRQLPPADRKCLQRPGIREALRATWREALRPGVNGALQDGFLFCRPWGFGLDEVRVPISLWHGEADIIVPPAMGRHVAAQLPRCRAQFLWAEGHFSLPIDHLAAILADAGPP